MTSHFFGNENDDDDDDEADDEYFNREANETNNNCYYAILNLPRTASEVQIRTNFKLLSRIYHPDKTWIASTTAISRSEDDAQGQPLSESSAIFVSIKNAVDVLSDPVYRRAYNFGGPLAVTLIKRSQLKSKTTRSRHSYGKTERENDDDDDAHHSEDENDDTDFYAILEQTRDEEDAVRVVQNLLRQYRMEQQERHDQHTMSPLEVSCSMPHVFCDSTNTSNHQPPRRLERESATFHVQSRIPVSNQLSATLGAGTELQSTAQSNFKTSASVDYQPVRGTHIVADVSVATPKRCSKIGVDKQNISVNLRTTRQMVSGAVIMAMLGGNMRKADSWTASILSSRPLSLEWPRPQQQRQQSQQSTSSTTSISKCTATWRIAYHPWSKRLRYAVASLRTLNEDDTVPTFTCRFSLGTSRYPFKITWQGAETNSFYATYSWGLVCSRIKLVRITTIDTSRLVSNSNIDDSSWTLRYGLKYDGHMFLTNGCPWSILLRVESENWNLRIPIALHSVAPLPFMASLLVAEFVDGIVDSVNIATVRTTAALPVPKWSTRTKEQASSPDQKSLSSNQFLELNPRLLDVIRQVALKKRAHESSKPDGLVIRQATWRCGEQPTIDVTDLVQFWVVDSQFIMSGNDSRFLQWFPVGNRIEPVGSLSSWGFVLDLWNSLIRSKRDKTDSHRALLFREPWSCAIRYQHNHFVYDVEWTSDTAADRPSSTIHLPNAPRATELGPSDRIL